MIAFWKAASIDEEPSLILTSWCIYEVAATAWHFAGYVSERGRVRISTAIVAFDPVTSRGKTQSGRVYELQGAPGPSVDVATAWDVWCRAQGIHAFADVTEAVLARAKTSH